MYTLTSPVRPTRNDGGHGSGGKDDGKASNDYGNDARKDDSPGAAAGVTAGQEVNAPGVVKGNAPHIGEETTQTAFTEGTKGTAPMSENAQGKRPVGVGSIPNATATTITVPEQEAQPQIQIEVTPDVTSEATNPEPGAKGNATDNGSAKVQDDPMEVDPEEEGASHTKDTTNDGLNEDKKPDEQDGTKGVGKKDKVNSDDEDQGFEPVIENPLVGQAKSGRAATSQLHTNGAASMSAQHSPPNFPGQTLGLPGFADQKPSTPYQVQIPTISTQGPLTTGSDSAPNKDDVNMDDAGSEDSDGLTGAVNTALDQQSPKQIHTTQHGSTWAAQPNQNRVASKEDESMEDAPGDNATNLGCVNTGGNDASQHIPLANGPPQISEEKGDVNMEDITLKGNTNSAPQNPTAQRYQNSGTQKGSQQAQQNVFIPGLNNVSFTRPPASQPQPQKNAESASHIHSSQIPPSLPPTTPAATNKSFPLFSGIVKFPKSTISAAVPETGFFGQDHTIAFQSGPAAKTPTAMIPSATAHASNAWAKSFQQGRDAALASATASGLRTPAAANPVHNASASASSPKPASGLQTVPLKPVPVEPQVDYQELNKKFDKELSNLVGDAPNRCSTSGNFGGLNNDTTAPTNLAGRPQNTRHVPTTKPAAQPAKGNSKQAKPVVNLTGYPDSDDEDKSVVNLTGYSNSDDEDKPRDGSAHDADDFGLTSEELKGSTAEEIAFHEREKQKHTEFLANMTPEERDEWDRQDAEVRAREQTPPRMSSSSGSIPADGTNSMANQD